MAKTVIFEFSPDDKVKTPLGQDGIVDMCAVDACLTNKYYVKVAANQSDWWTGEQLLNCQPEKEVPAQSATGST